MKIYLAGSVPKGAEEEKEFVNWRLRYKTVLEKIFAAEFIFPGAGDMDESDFLLIVGKDSRSIKHADLVIINAEERLGVGTAHEMIIAKYFKKPVVTVLPKNSYHRRANVTFQGKYHVEDWMHPFVHTFSDFIVETPAEIATIKNRISSEPVKDISIIDHAINHREQKAPPEPETDKDYKLFV
jgi:nucleoside 2-deoxyribosyltransferase